MKKIILFFVLIIISNYCFAQVTAVFTPDGATICKDSCIKFVDKSTYVNDPITLWSWTFDGGTPASFVGQNPPTVCYNSTGTYSVKLFVQNKTYVNVHQTFIVVNNCGNSPC